MPSRQLTEILGFVPSDFADPDADYRAVRAMMAPFHGHAVPAYVTVTEVELGGVRCAWYEDTRQPHRERVVFHCHGGGLVSSPLDDYHFYGAMLAGQLEARVVMADYRLAPEHPFPAATGTAPPPTAGSWKEATPTPPTWWSAGTRAAACWGWARSSTCGTWAWRRPPASCPSRAGSTSRCRTPSRVEDNHAIPSSPRRGSGTGAGTTPWAWWHPTTAALARLRRPDRPAAPLSPGRAVRHAPQGHRGTGPGGQGTRG